MTYPQYCPHKHQRHFISEFLTLTIDTTFRCDYRIRFFFFPLLHLEYRKYFFFFIKLSGLEEFETL